MVGQVNINFGDFGDLNGPQIIPQIKDDISNALSHDVDIDIVSLPGFDTPAYVAEGGRTGFPEAHCEKETKFTIQLNPELADVSVLAHELCHVLLAVRGFPRSSYATDEYDLFAIFLDMGRLLTDFCAHRWIDKYLTSKGFDLLPGQEKYFRKLVELRQPQEGKNDLALLSAVLLLKEVCDLPIYKKDILALYAERFPSAVDIFYKLSDEVRENRLNYNEPKTMYKSIIRLINIVGDSKDRIVGKKVSFQSLVLLHPMFIDARNLKKPAGGYFRYWVYQPSDTGRPSVLKFVYLYQKEESQRIGLAGINIVRVSLNETIRNYSRKLSTSTVGDFLNWLIGEGIIRPKWVRIVSG